MGDLVRHGPPRRRCGQRPLVVGQLNHDVVERLLLGKQVGSNDFALYGQEMNGSTWALCKMNMFLHEVDAAHIQWEDTIRHPQFVEDDALMKFDIVIANPPFSLDKWGQEMAAEDRYARFQRGIPPKSKGDWAFISHMLATAVEGTGRVGVVVPHGVLFRGGQEGKIREAVIRENLLDAVIGLPANLFYGTGIPACVLVVNKSKPEELRDKLLFINADREYAEGKNQNKLRPEDIEKIDFVFTHKREIPRYSRLVDKSEIVERLWVPVTHSLCARNWNCAAAGAPRTASRVANSWFLT